MRPALVETSGLEFKRLLDLLSRLEVRGGLLKDLLLPGSAKVDLHRAGGRNLSRGLWLNCVLLGTAEKPHHSLPPPGQWSGVKRQQGPR